VYHSREGRIVLIGGLVETGSMEQTFRLARQGEEKGGLH